MRNAAEKALKNGRARRLKAPPELIKLDIACGQNCAPGFVGIDLWPGAAIVHDLTKYPWPLADESVSECRCSHYIEHVPMLCLCCASQVDPLFRFFDELYRILVVGGKCVIEAPYYSSARAWQDPTHRRAISEWTFLYANKGWRVQNKLDHYPVHCDFDFTYGFSMTPEWANRAEERRLFGVTHHINVVTDIAVHLVKRPVEGV